MAVDPPVVDPHAVDEDPEDLLGEVTLDPWVDNTQLDWPNNDEDIDVALEDEVSDESGDENFVDDRDNVAVID